MPSAGRMMTLHRCSLCGREQLYEKKYPYEDEIEAKAPTAVEGPLAKKGKRGQS